MERRQKPRFLTDMAVEVTVLSTPPVRHMGRVVDLSGRGMRISMDVTLPSGTPVKIETSDSLVLAETSFCMHVGQGFLIGVRVDQVLGGLSDLERLRRRLINESSPEIVVQRQLERVEE